MGLVLMFAAGYVMGARAGSESLDEVVDALHAIRKSEEFHDLVKALRTHAADSLRGLASMLERERENATDPTAVNDLVERVMVIVGRQSAASPG
jgi:hypothetical protein